MNGLDAIGVRIESDARSGEGGYALAILREIESLLAELVDSGRSGRIDLRSLPLLPGDDARLADVLGEGEVDATIQAMGATRVRETAVPGVWWVTHRNVEGHTIAELIEVTLVPEILKTHREDARIGLTTLQERIADLIRGGESHV
jgi:hydrogenase-1 operon protein HyaF